MTTDGCTALIKATENDDAETVRCLVEQCGADVHVKSKKGDTAVRIATDRGFHEIQRILVPFVQPPLQADMRDFADNTVICPGLPFIRPFEIELTLFCPNGNIGGDFYAKWLDADVSVKLFIPAASRSAFEVEVRLWQQLRHPNVIKMYGACVAGPNLQFFVCEYASQGSLLELADPARFTRSTMWKWMHEAALGLEYLHKRNVIHGNLRCSSILVGSDGMAKLSNIGLSGSMSVTFSRAVIAARWQAPEVFDRVGTVT
ncbi:hypothetical protein PC120_g13601 [Phytophthora cactorum]|nr:hypothetical protein PC120_g13601 [Phytophthora cactorum]